MPYSWINQPTALTFLKENAFVNESDKSFKFKLFLLPILPSGEIIPDSFINATIGVFEKCM